MATPDASVDRVYLSLLRRGYRPLTIAADGMNVAVLIVNAICSDGFINDYKRATGLALRNALEDALLPVPQLFGLA